jgi:excinuclease ABC subunit A
MPELPLYGTEPRVRCKNLRGPWQEVELRIHSYEEIDRKEFWEFIDQAVAGFTRFTAGLQEKCKSDVLQPWKVLGRKWHFSRRGFPLGKTAQWEVGVLEELCELIAAVAPDGRAVWSNKQVVPWYVARQKVPWASVQTKKVEAVYLHLAGPKGRFTQGQITELGHEPRLDAQYPEYDVLRLKFRSVEELRRGDLAELLKRHLAEVEKAI